MLRGIPRLYSLTFSAILLQKLRLVNYNPLKLLYWFWHTKSFSVDTTEPAPKVSLVPQLTIAAGMVLQILVGIVLLIDWARFATAGAWEFGLALIISYPIIWAHAVVLAVLLYWIGYWLLHPKKLGRIIVCQVLEHQVAQLRQKHTFSVVAVAGSVGKTSTKLAIADLLSQTKRVQHQVGNYNDRVTVPLVFFGHKEPSLLNVIAWLKLFKANQAMIAKPYPYDVVVLELGTDAPGQLMDFAYVQPDISVVTAVTPEHMEYFKTIDAVAQEELSVFNYSKQVLVNADDIAGSYLAGRTFIEYSTTSPQAQYYAQTQPEGLEGQTLQTVINKQSVSAQIRYIGQHGAKFALAAAAVADILGVKAVDITKGLPKLKPFAGRMQVLPGIVGATLIDDTYNASPIAVKAALDTLYSAKASQRIAIIGTMNEMGAYSNQAHREVGVYCDPKRLDLLVTIGSDAKKWLAPAAKKQGCTVKSFLSPYQAGELVKQELKKNAVILVKGSQNGVFAEEALKPLLADAADEAKLVRQSAYWLKRKQQQFMK